MSFAFTNQSLSSSDQREPSIKSYKDPYDAYENKLNRVNNQQLSLIINGGIVEYLDTKLISVKWAIACTKRVLPIFEASYQGNNGPRRSIEAAELWVLNAYDATNDATHAINAVYDAAYDAADDAAYYVAAAAYYAAHAAVYYAKYAAKDAANTAFSVLRNTEIQWQRFQLKKIIKEHCKYYKKFTKLLCQRYPPELSSLIISNIF